MAETGEFKMNLLMLAQETTASDPWMIWYLAPVGAVLALSMAFIFSRNVMAQSEGDPDMIEIAEHVRAGAMAYLVRQYKVVTIVFVALIAILALLGSMPNMPPISVSMYVAKGAAQHNPPRLLSAFDLK